MVDVELNHLYQVNTTHLLMEVCSHIQWKREMQVEVFSGRGQWKRSTEVAHIQYFTSIVLPALANKYSITMFSIGNMLLIFILVIRTKVN